MTKMLRIGSCLECRERWNLATVEDWCSYGPLNFKLLGNMPAIPHWCELEDVPDIVAIEAQRDALRRVLVLAVPELHGEPMDPALDRRVLVELVRPIYDGDCL